MSIKIKAVAIMVLAVMSLSVSSAMALSDSEYKKMKKNSPEFNKADKELTQAWNEAKKTLNKSDFNRLKEEQREWIAGGRDDRAEMLIDEGMSRAGAYAVATRERVKEIRSSLIHFDTRQEAYMKTARDFIEKHKFPDGEKINDEDIENDFSGNKLSICDVNGDGKPELLIYFEETYMAAKLGYVCGFNEKTKKLTVELVAFPFFEFFDNGCVKAKASHNHTLSGEFWPYSLSKFNEKTGKYEDIGYVEAWQKEHYPKDYSGNPFPDRIDKTGDGIVYYISADGFDGKKPVDTPIYEKWISQYLDDAEPVEPEWFSADAKGLKALGKKRF